LFKKYFYLLNSYWFKKKWIWINKKKIKWSNCLLSFWCWSDAKYFLYKSRPKGKLHTICFYKIW